MNLPSITLLIEVARLGNNFVVDWHLTPISGTMTQAEDHGKLVFSSFAAFQEWVNSFAQKVNARLP